MPELPEVQTVVNRLKPALVGRTVDRVEIYWKRIIDRPAIDNFRSNICGRSISEITRRGKYIVIAFNSGGHLLVHLRMSGDLIIVPGDQPRGKHQHAVFKLNDGNELRFDDTRKFGRIYLVDAHSEVTGKLGPEPLSDDFTLAQFEQMLAERHSTIKTLLLNQQFLAGLGNIYVVESLWRAMIHPLRKASSLREIEIKKLYSAIRVVLNQALGSSGTDIGDGVWKEGNYRTRVYGREGLSCQRCKTPIKRIVLGQRGTEFCPKCQKRRR